MTTTLLADIATIVQLFVVTISLIFIWLQVREAAKQARIANAQTLVELSASFNLEAIKDREVARFWVNGAKDYDSLDEIEKYRFISLLYWWLNLQDHAYYEFTEGAMHRDVYKVWEAGLRKFVRERELWRFWPELEPEYQPGFVKLVSRMIHEEAKATSAPSDSVIPPTRKNA
jgi:hypothetical protein